MAAPSPWQQQPEGVSHWPLEALSSQASALQQQEGLSHKLRPSASPPQATAAPSRLQRQGLSRWPSSAVSRLATAAPWPLPHQQPSHWPRRRTPAGAPPCGERAFAAAPGRATRTSPRNRSPGDAWRRGSPPEAGRRSPPEAGPARGCSARGQPASTDGTYPRGHISQSDGQMITTMTVVMDEHRTMYYYNTEAAV